MQNANRHHNATMNISHHNVRHSTELNLIEFIRLSNRSQHRAPADVCVLSESQQLMAQTFLPLQRLLFRHLGVVHTLQSVESGYVTCEDEKSTV